MSRAIVICETSRRQIQPGVIAGAVRKFDEALLDRLPPSLTETSAEAAASDDAAQVGLVRDFCHVVAREKAAMGFFPCLGDVTRPMREEATKEGVWTSSGNVSYPKIQILTVAGLLAGTEHAQMPPQDTRRLLGQKAHRQNRSEQHQTSFGLEE